MNEEYCRWILTEDGQHETSCENLFEFNEGDCMDNKFTFCPYCGKPIFESKEQA